MATIRRKARRAPRFDTDEKVTTYYALVYTRALLRATKARGPLWAEFLRTVVALVDEAEADARGPVAQRAYLERLRLVRLGDTLRAAHALRVDVNHKEAHA